MTWIVLSHGNDELVIETNTLDHMVGVAPDGTEFVALDEDRDEWEDGLTQCIWTQRRLAGRREEELLERPDDPR